MINITFIQNNQKISVQAEENEKISEVMKKAGLSIVFPCGGHGLCGRCRIQTTQKSKDIPEQEKKLLGKDIEKGFRLACMMKAESDCDIYLPDTNILAVTDNKVPSFEREPLYQDCGMAVDIGTTTVVGQFFSNDQIIATRSKLNPQSEFGSDVISRIEASLAGRGKELQQKIVDTIEEMMVEMQAETGKNPELVVITGNTAMLHFLTNEDVTPLSRAPFAAKRLYGEWIAGEAIGISVPKIYLTPCFSAFVGGDIATAVLASDMVNKKETSLLVDIGTNGEMALLKDGKITCCSTAAGPVFEGAEISCGMQGKPGAIDTVKLVDGNIQCTTIGNTPAIGICGSGLIDAIATLRKVDRIDDTGAMDEDQTLKDGVVLTGQDVRNVQLAKSAIHAGLRTLCETSNVPLSDVKAFYLAGGFGAKLNIHSAVEIGMIPKELEEKTVILGNAALAGASMILRSKPMIKDCEEFINSSETIELSSNPIFTNNYMEYMMF